MTALQESPLWAITSYFNPMGWQRRRDNYRVFRHHLRQLPLATIEWSADGRFELGAGDAELLIQLSGGDLMWQKERLLNLLLPQLPKACRAVAWLDADVVFERASWVEETLQALRQQVVVQLFSRVHNMGPVPWAQWLGQGALASLQASAEPDSPETGAWPVQARRTGILAAIASGGERAPSMLANAYVEASVPDATPGYAWAATREWLCEFPLFDTWVIGGGDAAYGMAVQGAAPYVVERQSPAAALREAYLAAARRMADAAQGRVGFVPGLLHTLWHGELPDRRYRERYRILSDHGFDPVRDLRPASSGVWCWSDHGRPLAAAVHAYMTARREDG